MARRTPAPVWFETRRSCYLLTYLLAVHGAAGLALWVAAIPGPARWVAGSALLAGLAWQLRRHVLRRGTAAVRAVHWLTDGRWRVRDGTGRITGYPEVEVVLAVPALIILRLSGPAGVRSLMLAADSAEPQALRRLRVRLRGLYYRQQRDQGRPLAGT